ncbi:LysR family transcriptional regulator [Actinocorallia sp. A-T 12471]|uniref:LysR family transcriptional regulator n=1 Tax=Actinocorallia sp. A-T 12471 TaxID=3089813 RepID=UPI0029CBDB84|nr:LysR family transcriptional regulator [Actinocorallia sp. A-T 12471]MDX6742369.1 LysR family transcriptional regulator [Actinocorallia sp. A-T 12471]
MNLAQLRALRAVHEAGSVTGAADLLGVTQSAVSHALTSLENELGMRLVIRERSGCCLTEVGRRLMPHVVGALHHVERFAEEAAAASGLLDGRVRIGAFPSACRVLPRFVRAFRKLHPAVDVVLLEGTDAEVEEWIGTGVIDLGVVSGPRPDLRTVPLAADEFLAVLPSAHPLAAERAVGLADLSDDPFLLSAAGCEPLIRAHYRAVGLDLSPAHRVQRMDTLLAMVREDLGVSVVPSLALPELLDGIRAIPLRPPAPRSLLLAAPADTEPTPAARAFLDAVTVQPPAPPPSRPPVPARATPVPVP